MNRLVFQLDEDCQATALAAALWEHAIEAVTTNAAGLKGADDETQLREASGKAGCRVSLGSACYMVRTRAVARHRCTL